MMNLILTQIKPHRFVYIDKCGLPSPYTSAVAKTFDPYIQKNRVLIKNTISFLTKELVSGGVEHLAGYALSTCLKLAGSTHRQR